MRLLRVCSLQGSPWEWLAPCAASGAPLARPALVARCAADPGTLAALCALADAGPGGRSPPAATLAFYAVTACEALGACRAVGEAAARAVLPGVVAGLARGAGPERRGAAMMVGAALAARAALGDDLVAGEGGG